MRICILTGSWQYQTDAFVGYAVAHVIANFRRHGHEVLDWQPYSSLYVDQSRNDLLSTALEAGVDRVLFWDADQVIWPLPGQDLAALFDVGPAVTAAYLSRRDPGYYVLWQRVSADRWAPLTRADLARHEQPFPVARAGAGALWLRRELLTNTLSPPWFIGGYQADGHYLGEDVYFCEELEAAGVKLLCQPAICTGHAFAGLLAHRPPGVTAQDLTIHPDELLRIAAGDAWAARAEREHP